ncbi:MAG TPA: hypothetical protein ENN21_01960 [Spirochaetes bacterium]|nr:hypothetical protein [Spirochaetota bacterium]
MDTIAAKSSDITIAADEEKQSIVEVSKAVDYLNTIMEGVIEQSRDLRGSLDRLHALAEDLKSLAAGR